MDEVIITLEGHYSQTRLAACLEPIRVEIRKRPNESTVLVDALKMTGYDSDARTWLVNEWFARHKQ